MRVATLPTTKTAIETNYLGTSNHLAIYICALLAGNMYSAPHLQLYVYSTVDTIH